MTRRSAPDGPPTNDGSDDGHEPVKHPPARSFSARIVLLAGAGSLALGLILGAAGAHVLWRPAATPARATPAATPTQATPAANPAQATAQKWLAAFTAKNLSAMKALFAPNGTWVDGTIGDRASGGPKAEDYGWASTLPEVQAVRDARIIGLGDGVAIVAYTLHAVPPAASPPKLIDMPFVAVLRVQNGHISAETIYYNARTAFGPACCG